MIDAIRTTLEIIYFACAPLLLIAAIIGLWQLKISKDASRLIATRESLRLAASQCEHYTHNILPLINTLDEAIDKHDIVFFKKAIVDIKDGRIRIRPNLSKEALIAELDKLILIVDVSLDVYNALESFAVFFISGVADEQVAFSSVGKTYCDTAKKYLPDIMLAAQNHHFQNLIKLFLLWHGRIDRLTLLEKRSQLEARINRISNDYIEPVGTD